MEHTKIREQVESHSSSLFNQRVDKSIMSINQIDYEANNAMPLTLQHIISYFAALKILFVETSQAYYKSQNVDFKEKIEEYITKVYKDLRKIKLSQQCTVQELDELLDYCNQLRHMMQTGLHNVSYFFRFAKYEPKSIKDTLKLFGPEKEDENKQ